MPKGHKLIDWTPENDARLMLTILTVENVHPNCEAVAAAFGRGVNAQAIANRLSRLRKKGADEGFLPTASAVASTKGRKGSGAGKKGDAGKKGEIVADGSDAESHVSVHEDSNEPPTQKKTAGKQKVLTGRVTKTRPSGKKNIKDIVVKASNAVDAEFEDDGSEGALLKDEGNDGEEDTAGLIKVEEGA